MPTHLCFSWPPYFKRFWIAKGRVLYVYSRIVSNLGTVKKVCGHHLMVGIVQLYHTINKSWSILQTNAHFAASVYHHTTGRHILVDQYRNP